MAFHLKVGQQTLSDYVRLQPGEGFDPHNGAYVEPAFGESPLRDGGALLNVDVKNREMVVPLILQAATKDALFDLVRDINRELKEGKRVEFRDDGSTDITYFDLVSGRLEVEFNFWRQVARHVTATLRLWVRPYGHTATSRMVASIASGPFYQFAPAGIDGDVDAETTYRIRSLATAQAQGMEALVAALPHPSYIMWWPPASILATSAIGGVGYSDATLMGASGAPASQVLLMEPDSILYRLPGGVVRLPNNNGEYTGRNRIFALTRIWLGKESVLRAQEMGGVGGFLQPTVALREHEGYELVDMGAFDVPSGQATAAVEFMNMRSQATVFSAAQYYNVGLAGVFVVPDQDYTWLRNPMASVFAYDDFRNLSPGQHIASQPYHEGDFYYPFVNNATQWWRPSAITSGGRLTLRNPGATAGLLAYHQSDTTGNFSPPARGGRTEITFQPFRPAGVSTGAMIGINIGYWDVALVNFPNASQTYFTLRFNNPDTGTATVLASMGFSPTIGIAAPLVMSLDVKAPHVEGRLRVLGGFDNTLHHLTTPAGGSYPSGASVGASTGYIITQVAMGRSVLAHTPSMGTYPFLLDTIKHETYDPNGNPQASCWLLADGERDQSFYSVGGTDAAEPISGYQRGRLPRIGPSTALVGIFAKPLRVGAANNNLSIEVRVRERFNFAR